MTDVLKETVNRDVCHPDAGDLPARFVDTSDDLEAINRLYAEREWSDGLPIVPPTEARVARMLAATSRRADDVIADLAPAFGAATVELIAVNAVMAGCAPAAMPWLLAAVEAVADPAFNLQAVQATTNPVAVWVIVNGPAAATQGYNGGFNCLGEGVATNATLGRALRLVLRNIGGGLPGKMDRATHGQPGKFTFCCAENEADTPWPALHVERGFAPGDNTVTVVAAEGTMNMNTHAKDAADMLRVFAETMQHPPSNEYTHGGEPWLLFSPEHAQILAAEGLDKDAVRARLWELSKLPAGRMAARDYGRTQASRREELGAIGKDTLLPIARSAVDICIVVAGGPGTHTVYVPCFGNSRAVTRKVEPA